MSEWMDIETAPKDGTKFLAICPDMFVGYAIVSWNIGKYEDWVYLPIGWKCKPTHWMPLPAPPVEVKEDEQGT